VSPSAIEMRSRNLTSERRRSAPAQVPESEEDR
jgi:hypothetical protein